MHSGWQPETKDKGRSWGVTKGNAVELRTRNSIVHRVGNEWRNTFTHFSFKSASTERIRTRRHAGRRKGTKTDTKETVLTDWHGLGFIKNKQRCRIGGGFPTFLL